MERADAIYALISSNKNMSKDQVQASLCRYRSETLEASKNLTILTIVLRV